MPATGTVLWTVCGEDRQHTLPCVLGRADPADHDAVCSITHDPIAAAETPGLPQRWRIGAHEYDSMRMQCGHTFHASTLMLHFLLNDMRCPVCRHGVPVTASIESVPASVAAVFEDKLSQMQEHATADDLGTWTLMSSETLEQGLRLVVEVHCVQSVTVMTSLLTDVGAEPSTWGPSLHHVFRAQQSFYRRVERHVHSQESPVLLVFRLWHLLLDDTISSAELSLNNYTRMCTGERLTRAQEQRRQFVCDEMRCGELLPGTSAIHPFVCSLNRDYLRMLLLQGLHQYLEGYA